jgi:hypothetical protein
MFSSLLLRLGVSNFLVGSKVRLQGRPPYKRDGRGGREPWLYGMFVCVVFHFTLLGKQTIVRRREAEMS